MFADCAKSPDIETGGILAGKYLEKGTVARILEAFRPSSDSVGGRSSFRRGTSGLAEALASRWSQGLSYYVGEWHYHPLGDGLPSDADTSQMILFAREDGMQSSVPILVIVFRSADGQYGVRVFLSTRDGRTLALQNGNDR